MQSNTFTLAKATVLLLVIGISLMFFFMIRGFFMALVLSAIFSGLMYGVFEKLTVRLKGRRSLASVLTVLLFLLLILIPLSAFTIVVVEQAIDAGRSFLPMMKERMADPDAFVDELESIELINQIFPDKEKLLNTLNSAVNSIGGFLASGLSTFTSGAANFFFQLFVFLFAMYYFLLNGKQYLNRMLYYMPLRTSEERRLLDKFVTVTRSNLKGTLIMGIVQGGVSAIALAIAGVQNTLFWGVVMMVLSIIPAVGPAIVLIPASVFLILGGHTTQGVALLLFTIIVVGNIDNLLRPRLIGKDTKLPDLMIFCGLLGGLAFFGVSGFIIGPVFAALFIAIWEIYGETFKDQLQPVEIPED